MFDAKLAKRIQDEIRDEHRAVPSLEDIMFRLTPVTAITSGCTPVFSMQYGDLTILVALYPNEDGEIFGIRVKLISW